MTSRTLLILALNICLASTVFGATFTSTGSGNWNVGTTWGGACAAGCTAGVDFPGAGDNAIIASTHTVTVNVVSACTNLTMNGTSTLTGTTSMAIGGNLTMNGISQITGTGTYTVAGNFLVPALQNATFGGIQITITGTTTIGGYFQFGVSGSGTKTFNNTISVGPGGTWDNIVGEDPVINCSIVNGGNWIVPTGGNGRYNVNVAGVYTYTGNTEIAMTRLNITAAATVTNLGILTLTKNGTDALTVSNAGATFNNGNGIAAAYLNFTSHATSVNLAAGTIDFSRANNTVDYSYAGNQNVYATTYYKLKASTSGIKTLVGATVVTNEVNISGSAVLNANTQAFSGTSNLVMTGSSELQLSRIGFTLPEFTGTANSLAAGTTITFNGAGAQTAKGSSAVNPSTTNTYPYQNINLSGNLAASNVDFTNVSLVNGNLTFTDKGRINSNPVLTVAGTFYFGLPSPPAVALTATTVLNSNITVGSIEFNGGTLNYSNRSITINGNNGTWTNNGGATFSNNATSQVIFTTGTNQQITGTVQTVFPNITINNANGVSLNGVDTQVQNTLTFTVGNLVTGSNLVYVNGAVARTSGFVEGNLQKDVAAGASTSVQYEVGTGTTYAFVDLVFTNVGTPGTVTCSTTAGDNPDINGSNIEPNKSANRWWSLTNSGTIFTTYSATFNFAGGVPVDLDVLATPANFQVKRSDGLNWFTTTVGVRTGTSTQFTAEPFANLPNLTRQDFQCGEIIVTTGILNRLTGANNWNNKVTWIENRTGTITFNGTTSVSGVGTLFLTELADGDVIMLQTSPGTVRGVVAVGGRTSNTTLTLVAAAGAAAGGYGRQRIPNAIGDAVTIGNSNIADAVTDINFDMPGATTINSLDINTTASPRTTAQSVTHSVSSLLTIQTNARVNQPGGAATDSWNINTGQATVNGNLSIANGDPTLTRIARVVTTVPAIANTGLTVGNLIFGSTAAAGNEVTAVLDMSGGAGRVNVLNQLIFTNNTGRLIPGASSTFNYQRSATGQRINWPSGNNNATKWIYNNLRLNNTSAAGAFIQAGDDITTATNATINVTGDIRVETGSLITSNNTDITGGAAKTFQIDPGATFSMTGNSSTFPTGFGTFSLGTAAPFGLVSYEQSNAITVASPAAGFGSLQILNNGFNVILPAVTTVAGNLTIGDGVTVPNVRGIAGGVTLTVTNNVIINSNAILTANAAGRIRTFNIGGNWTNNGTFTPSANAGDAGVVFTGTGTIQPQTIGGTASDSFVTMTLNTAATTNTVQLLKPITVSNVLTLTRGGLDLNGQVLNITNSAVGALVSGGAFPSQGYVKSEGTTSPYGEINWSVGNNVGTYVYPFGKSSTEYIPLTINVTVAGAPAAGKISAWTYASATDNTPLPSTVNNLNGTTGGNSVVDRFWGVTGSGYITTRPTATLIFTAVGGSAPTATPPSERPGSIANLALVTASPAGIAAQSWNPADYWDPATAGQTFSNNSPNPNFFSVTAPGIQLQNTYLPFTLTDASAPLPIQLVEFEARYENREVNVNWKTETEVNNDYFTVQKTLDAENFKEVTRVKGAGTSTSPKVYSTVDNQLSSGKWYYRLKQTDLSGGFTYSKLVSIEIPENLLWTVYPNPSNGSAISINFTSNDLGKSAYLKLQDIEGRELLQVSTPGLTDTKVNVELPQRLAMGFYIITIAVEQQMVRQKLIVR